MIARAWRSIRDAFHEARAWGGVLSRWPAPPDLDRAERDGFMAVADLYPLVIWRTWLDEAKTKPVYEAHVLFASAGWQVIGQGETPSKAEKDAREALAFCLEDAGDEGNPPSLPFMPGRDAILITFSDDGCININHVHPRT